MQVNIISCNSLFSTPGCKMFVTLGNLTRRFRWNHLLWRKCSTMPGADLCEYPLKINTIETLTPFVNRRREITELALHNAFFIHRFRELGAKNIRNFIHFNFVYAAQMYGAGKTRIGDEFVNQIGVLLEQENAFHEYCPGNLKYYLPELLAILKEFSGARTKWYDLNEMDFAGFVKDTVPNSYNSEDTGTGHGITLSNFLVKECVSADAPIFFHFDEVGNFNVDDLRSLRYSCLRTIRKLDSYSLKTSFPFFFFSGRGAAYSELNSSGSIVGSHWLILEPLKRSHVTKVMNESTLHGKYFQFHKHLPEVELNFLVDSLIEWTGGAPRPLLFACHMLEALHGTHGEKYKTSEGLKNIFNMLVKFISEDSELESQLGPVSRRGGMELEEVEQKAYDYFIFQSWLGKTVNRTFPLSRSQTIKSDTFLRSFNVFAKAVGDSRMQLVVPSFVSALLEKHGHGMSFSAIYEQAYPGLVQPECAFEISLGVLALMYQKLQAIHSKPILFPKLIPEEMIPCNPVLDVWTGNGPKVSPQGKLTESQVDDIVKNKGNKEFPHQLRESMMGYFCDQLKIGAMVRFAPKSASCDTIVKVAEKFVIEFQFKSGKTHIGHKSIQNEIKKSVVYKSEGYKSLFVMLCASGGDDVSLLEEHPNITVYIPTVTELKDFFGKRFLTEFQKSP